MRAHPFFGYLLLLVTALSWAGAWITARVAAHDAPPMTVTAGRFLVASLLLLPVWWVLGRGRPVRLRGSDWLVLLGMSLSGIMAYTVIFLIGIAHAPASDGAVITPGLVGPFTIVLVWFFLRDKPQPRKVVGMLLSLAGVTLVGWSAVRAAGSDSARVVGDVWFVAGALTWASYTALGRKLADRVPAVTGVLLCSAIGGTLMVPIAWMHDGVPNLRAWSAAAWINMLYLGSFATALGFTAYYLGVRIVGVGRAMPSLGLVPFFGVLGAALLLGEHLTPLHALGGALVIAGIVVPAVGRPRAASSG
jgi:drug/metabolite transporter (DMT)-like permease